MNNVIVGIERLAREGVGGRFFDVNAKVASAWPIL